MPARQSAEVTRAIAMVAKGMTAYAAAKKTGIALSTIYRAIKRRRYHMTVKCIKCATTLVIELANDSSPYSIADSVPACPKCSGHMMGVLSNS